MEPAQPIVADLEAMAEVADQGIVSKSIVENEHHKIIHFTFAPGQELSEHTASVPAVIHILRGR
ncbi:MAG: cupin, partial [Actinomycetes bacterium]